MYTNKIELPNRVVFYTIERAIKEYRNFAQKHLSDRYADITIDQALILILIADNPEMTQDELSKIIFKEKASVSRMIETLRKNGYLERKVYEKDRRRHQLIPSKKGKIALEEIMTIVKKNREIALSDFSTSEISTLNMLLNKMIQNCNQNK